MSERSKTRARLLAIARLVFALGLLAFVAWILPWSDKVSWVAGKDKLELSGKIEGEWRSDRIRFQKDADAAVPAGWPEDSASALARGEKVELVRVGDDNAAARYEWHPGMPRVFRDLDASRLVLAMAMLGFAAIMSVTRWWRLLALAGCPTSWWNALRLTFLGFFFNLVVPGLTGGDVIKAVLVVRENPQARADALVTVIVDRGLGLIVLAGLAALVVCFPGAHFQELRWPVLLGFGGMVLGVVFVMHPLPRRLFGISRLLERLPQRERLKSIERSLERYTQHPGEMALAAGLSVLNHGSIAAAICVIGRAFGETHLSYPEYLGITAIANTVSSLPIAPSGLGVGEVLIGYLFHLLGSTQPLGVAVSVTYRLLTVALNLSGGIFLLLPGGKEVREEMEHEKLDAESEPNIR